jgi:hypothetical protein
LSETRQLTEGVFLRFTPADLDAVKDEAKRRNIVWRGSCVSPHSAAFAPHTETPDRTAAERSDRGQAEEE